MEISEVRVKLMSDKDEKLQAFCSVTFENDFVIRDLKIISGAKGPFVAMPSRKLMDRCPKCRGKNHLRARFCNDCGLKLDPNRAQKDKRGRARLHTDVAHPINSHCREVIQERILAAFEEELERSKLPGYVAPSMEDDYLDDYAEDDFLHEDRPERAEREERDDSKARADKQGLFEKEKKRSGEDSFDAGIFS